MRHFGARQSAGLTTVPPPGRSGARSNRGFARLSWQTLALKVRSIGEGAALTVEDNTVGTPVFRR
jgi:hypothetical protein